MERSVVNGPGVRFVLWVQGCTIHCPGCINPDLLPLVSHHIVKVSDMARRIISTPGIEGVTFTGGEPTLQADALAELCSQIKDKGLTILCYSGYRLEELRSRNNSGLSELLAQIDLLIDGPYMSAESAPLPWRGSHNQRLHFLSPAYVNLSEEYSVSDRQIELIVGSKFWTMTGTWENHFRRRLEELLATGIAESN